MFGYKKLPIATYPASRSHESGVALLTVLALLSIFAVILAGFTYSLKMEEFSVRMYGETVTVDGAAQAAIQGTLSQIAKDMDPANPHTVLGRRQPRFISQMDPWYVGYAGRIGGNMSYDARSRILDARPERALDRMNAQFVPTPIPRGVDEDPPKDVTGGRAIGLDYTRIQGDGFPGLQGIDDDLDGVIDHDYDGDGRMDEGYSSFDDDEDGLIDEDGYDPRPADRSGVQTFFAPGTGFDWDGDRLGVFDESAKININFAGNTGSISGDFTYNQGLSPAELDLAVYLFNRFPNNVNPENTAKAIVNYRHGSVSDGGATWKKPGEDNKDDNGNSNPRIFDVEKYSNVFTQVSQFQDEPFVILGDGIDNDGDGLVDEEDERYIGPVTYNSSGTPHNDPIENSQTVEDFRPGDKIDNDGDGQIDERDEGIDEPAEFSVTNPKGDDHPFSTVEELMAVQGIGTAIYKRLDGTVTIYSQSDQVSGPLSGEKTETQKINPNSIHNWQASPYYDNPTSNEGKVDVQYNPPVRLEDLLVLQVDNDYDWQLEAEPDVLDGKPDGIDNDGDGLIDEPGDDWDNNLYPSADFDTFMEPDLASPFFRRNSVDDDRDGRNTDERPGTIEATRNSRILARDDRDSDIMLGINLEGDGQDNDGDGLIDDDGDFNGDGLISYDPEWHLNEDAYGDLNGDGYPGLGAPLEGGDDEDEEIIKDPDYSHDLLITSFADDDWDGYADFYDPQVLAAMITPELDGVDNDNDGEVDEIGERYIACFDDDEDGRVDEDSPEFQIALNLIDYIDTWMPSVIADDPDVQGVLNITNDQNPVLSDPVTQRTFTLYTSRQRAFRMNPYLTAGVNTQSRDSRLYTELIRFLLPNPPETGMKVAYEGVESIRINEVMPKPVIRLEPEDCLEAIVTDNGSVSIQPGNRFRVLSGADDDGPRNGAFDTNWGTSGSRQDLPGVVIPNGFIHLPEGFRNTFNPFVPIANMDALAPAFIFSVTNLLPPAATDTDQITGINQVEEAEWTFENLPAGIYDVVVYLHPQHVYNPAVHYFFNGDEVTFRSDFRYKDVVDGWGAAMADGAVQQAMRSVLGASFGLAELEEWIRRDTAYFKGFGNGQFGTKIQQKLPYRLTAFPPADFSDFSSVTQRVVIDTDGVLKVRIRAEAPIDNQAYVTSFDRLELYNLSAQYVELVNIGTEDVDLSGWTINTPYGHYILPKDSVIQRMKPGWRKDDGQELTSGEGHHGTGVPFEPLLTEDNIRNNTMDSNDFRNENNKLLVAFDKVGLINFLRQNNFPVTQIPNYEQYIVQPSIAQRELARMQDATIGYQLNAQPLLDQRFRLVDVQEDILTDNPAEKQVSLYDPAGGYIDRFTYRTTFNNAIVDIPNNSANYDLVALPGYKGFESFERSDPTWFDTELKVSRSGVLSAERKVPSSIKLDAKQAIVSLVTLDQGDLALSAIGGYTDTDPNHANMTRFSDIRRPGSVLAGFVDKTWGGWDFLGDFYMYPKDYSDKNLLAMVQLFENSTAMGREAAIPKRSGNLGGQITRFYQMLGGFENFSDVKSGDIASAKKQLTAFTWRMGLRELIRAGYDPNVDDQLTVRVLGRNYVASNGDVLDINMPVGEVMVLPAFAIVNPGNTAATSRLDVPQIYTAANKGVQLTKYVDRSERFQPIFSKLRNGDTAFTINLREQFEALRSDLNNTSGDEPKIEITVFIRKTTRDISPLFVSETENNAEQGYVYPVDRPDLSAIGFPTSGGETAYNVNNNLAGYVATAAGQDYNPSLGALGDDNYFFKGIELFGRNTSQLQAAPDAKLAYLGGTPGWDNTGYVPAYPRRRLQLNGQTRDELDIIDNTAFVKNGPLATVGELSRLFTGNRFETVNMPIIPQRLEDMMFTQARPLTNPELGMRAISDDESRVRLAQRERLDQWENQYSILYDIITTYTESLIPGLININTAPREVLMALPATPLEEPGQLARLQDRFQFNAIVADFILEGREPGGHDMYFGMQDLDDDLFLSTYTRTNTKADTISDYKVYGTGRELRYYKDFDDIQDYLSKFTVEDVRERRVSQFRDMYLATGVSYPDDGPYPDLGTLFSQITHLQRSVRFSKALSRSIDRNWDGQPDGVGDLRERLNTARILARQLTPEDMEEMMNRISNLVTVRSRAFGIITQGRIFDSDGNIVAQRRFETVYKR